MAKFLDIKRIPIVPGWVYATNIHWEMEVLSVHDDGSVAVKSSSRPLPPSEFRSYVTGDVDTSDMETVAVLLQDMRYLLADPSEDIKTTFAEVATRFAVMSGTDKITAGRSKSDFSKNYRALQLAIAGFADLLGVSLSPL